jgi:APA family basic amino acid/polyamine antiporter
MAERGDERPKGRSTNFDAIVEQSKTDRKRLDSSALGVFSLTALGIASVVGAGIFATTGTAAAEFAGPAVVISFVLAGIAAAAMAVSYAELASMIPAAGSTYSYAYAIFGVFPAWFIGWDLLLEYLFAASTVAVSWSGYAVSLIEHIGINVPESLSAPPFGADGVINLPAVIIVGLTTALLAIGMRQSARANNSMVILKMFVLVLFVIVGATVITASNWDPFVPAHGEGFGDYGVGGILRGAGLVFFAYIGFDAVSTAAAESRNPQRTVPIGLLLTVLISTLLYVAIGLVMTGMTDYTNLNVADPLAKAIESVGGLGWLRTIVGVGAVVGLASTVMVTFYGQTRIFMRMSSDGMLPPAFGHVSRKRRTPVFSTVLCGIVGAAVAGLLPIDTLAELVSIGTLLAFVIVCAGVLYLRRTHPEAERPFKVPHVNLVAGLGIASAIGLMASLPNDTWFRLAGWLVIGLVIFFTYARPHTRAKMAEVEASAGSASGG